MADKIIGKGFIGSPLSGRKVTQIYGGVQVASSLTEYEEPAKIGIVPDLLIGDRTYSANLLLSDYFISKPSTSGISVPAQYSILNTGTIGKRIYPNQDRGVLADYTIAQFSVASLHGTSTRGIFFDMESNIEVKAKEVRKWPRNWYGDNIKN